MKQIIVLLVFIPCLAFGQSINKDSITYRGIRLELVPSTDHRQVEAFAVYQFDSITDTLYPRSSPYYFKSDWPSDLKVTLFVVRNDSSAPQQLAIFDSLKTTVTWGLPNLSPSDSIVLFEEGAEEEALLVPLTANSLDSLRHKPYLKVVCWEKTYRFVRVVSISRYYLESWDPSVFVFKNPWIAPGR